MLLPPALPNPGLFPIEFVVSSTGEHGTLPEGIRGWIGRALQLDPRHSFASARDARDDLDRVLAGEEDDEEPVVAVPEMKTSAAPIQLLIRRGDRYETLSIAYHGGLRYPHLERITGTPDGMGDMLTPRN